MDNLPAHKVAGAREATETAGVNLLYLQPNFRGLNPIEMASSKRKSIRRAAAPRSAQDHWQTSRRMRHFTASECRNYFIAADDAPLSLITSSRWARVQVSVGIK